MKVIVTKEMLELEPALIEQGVNVGDEIELGPSCNEDGSPVVEPASDEAATLDDVIGDGTRPVKGPK